ncbi:HD domain-containing phosphohydrolase [Sporomusa acidovorans]|uniref:Cyclic di-GMP phosphodiesterase response regulator RpfG n=1 Tax=Sporomusa acidovorans (strain ATCC 49682 / DSM 3132 / Mol) TaxID=1123286 RepID=A0ABZ3IYC1_SPOA4|nr:HD domain-containing phosphohydrolase [Sporomusa acidovorans]OZC17678.1 cyclic di-GMP phosphodiesterase response regulator RpfG [Sporomusa acidovorans DSM 3132]SDE11789.1 PAS domain S-box-containing protein/HDIG domain-containing protein [Sporomusa acidovorans]
MNEVEDKAGLKPVLAQWKEQEDFNFYLAILSHQFNHVFQHSERVAHYAVSLAKAIGCSESEILNVGAAAMLHDIGKINVPIKVLYKQGVYNRHDREEMERHSVYGYQMLLRSKELRQLASIVLHHHERCDGNGYPKRLQRQEIPLAARIIFVAEAFDVMTTVQNYQYLRNGEQALAELKRMAGSQFDETLVDAFIQAPPKIMAEMKTDKTIPVNQEEMYQVLAAGGVMRYMRNIANLGIICLDKNNTVVFCNSYAEKMRQLPAGSLLGKNFLDNYPSRRRKILEGKLLQLREGENNEWYRLMGRDGKFIENRYSRVFDEQGSFIGTVLVTIDVTARETVSRSLSAALERQAALYQAAQIITSALNIGEVIDGILRIIKRIIVVNRATIDLLPAKNSSMEAIGILGQGCHNATEKLRNTLRTVTVDDPKNKRTEWYIPIIYRSELLGILFVEKVIQKEDDKEKLELLEALASQTAVAIRNAKLQEEVAYLAECLMQEADKRMYENKRAYYEASRA